MLLWAQKASPLQSTGGVPIAVDAFAAPPARPRKDRPWHARVVVKEAARRQQAIKKERDDAPRRCTYRRGPRRSKCLPGAAANSRARRAPAAIKINTRSGESVDSVIMRLRREVNKSGHLRTLRHKRFHEDAREKKKRKVAEARRKMKFMRQRKRRSQQQGP